MQAGAGRASVGKTEILTGYIPGVIGRVAQMRAVYYSRDWNFGGFFEAKVASELSEFINAYDDEKDCIWSVVQNGSIEGSITIDSSSEKDGEAHLRWFIVSDTVRGKGAGSRLMKKAMDFCRAERFRKIYLWTFKGLDPARHLYRKFGFEMVEEQQGSQWGTRVTEQRYELRPG